ncbi:MAG: hypothetical protein KatS3mg111_1946 [Pirellulaceae bacterium]|nr:MAG: hypothetical protein KatS3mg111_1946 [Pirellulaceae bacterium]
MTASFRRPHRVLKAGGEAQPAVYHLSDGDTEKTTEQETTIRKKPRNRYVDEVPAALSTNDQEERDTNSAVVLASAKKVTGGSSDAVREPTLDEQPIPQRSAGDGAGEGGAVTGEAALKSATIRQLALALIDKLEGAAEQTSNPDEQVDYAKKRRLVNLVIDDLDGALQPIPDLQPEAQDYVAHTFQALYDATDINGNPVANRRWTLALRSHRTAENALAKLANLEVKNLAFCTEVLSFGVITKFPQYHFRPDQEVLLYCELENFVSQAVRGGYETQLQGSYEIVDAQGRRIADQILPEDTDFCGNQREDFYVAYRFHMPSRLEPGRHELRLTIEDMKGHKFGQGKIDFHVVR